VARFVRGETGQPVVQSSLPQTVQMDTREYESSTPESGTVLQMESNAVMIQNCTKCSETFWPLKGHILYQFSLSSLRNLTT